MSSECDVPMMKRAEPRGLHHTVATRGHTGRTTPYTTAVATTPPPTTAATATATTTAMTGAAGDSPKVKLTATCETTAEPTCFCQSGSETGPLASGTGSLQSETGPLPSETGPLPSETGPLPSETGPLASETGPLASETGPLASETGTLAFETGPRPSETGPLPDDTGPLPDEMEPLLSETGPLVSETGPLASETGLLPSGTGPLPSGTGPLPSGTGPLLSETGTLPAEMEPLLSETGPLPPETGPLPPETGPLPPETGPLPSEMGPSEEGQLACERLTMISEQSNLSEPMLPDNEPMLSKQESVQCESESMTPANDMALDTPVACELTSVEGETTSTSENQQCSPEDELQSPDREMQSAEATVDTGLQRCSKLEASPESEANPCRTEAELSGSEANPCRTEAELSEANPCRTEDELSGSEGNPCRTEVDLFGSEEDPFRTEAELPGSAEIPCRTEVEPSGTKSSDGSQEQSDVAMVPAGTLSGCQATDEGATGGGIEGEGMMEEDTRGAIEGEAEGEIEGETGGMTEREERAIAGETEGETEGAIEGVTEGEMKGAIEGVTEGEMKGAIEGVTEGETKGAIEGVTEGETKGAIEGVTEGVMKGAIEGVTEGVMEGEMEGVTEGVLEGQMEGVTEGVLEGQIEGVTEAVLEGEMEGNTGGMTEGAMGGAAEGMAGAMVGRTEGVLDEMAGGAAEGIVAGTSDATPPPPMQQNGHLSAADLTNGVGGGAGSDGSQSPGCALTVEDTPPPPASHSPTCQHYGDTSSPPHPSGQQHVVHVHVNPGETFSVRVGTQIQHIQGPATVRMVSNNGPPMPMPMQVPLGHMVQQIVDENGILTHVILSPQPPGLSAPPMTGGPSSTPPQQQMYSSYGPAYPTTGPVYPAAGQYPGGGARTPHHPGGQPHVGGPAGGAPAPHIHPGTPPPPPTHCTGGTHMPQGPPVTAPLHHNHSLDERTVRQKHRLQEKLSKRYKDGYYPNHTAGSGRHATQPKVNGDTRRSGQHSSSSSGDGQELEEERNIIRKLLSSTQLPKISELECRSALIQLSSPECDQHEFDIHPSEFKYELQLSEKGRDGKYKHVYSGDATEITLKDLKPATEYHLRVSSLLDDLKGELTEPVSFQTLCCEPDSPHPPKLSSRNKTSLLLKWNATADNGSKISSYSLECDQGRADGHFVEVYNGLQRQFKVTKLTSAVGYTFRLSAINSVGKSGACDSVCYVTSGSAPAVPACPRLLDAAVRSVTLSWLRRPTDDTFTLQMEDFVSGHGFLTQYNGPDLTHKVKNLRRNTEYKFRLQARNEEGDSQWSETESVRTLPDRPLPPSKPALKGKQHATSIRLLWDAPKDNGGSDITKYILELDSGRGFSVVYEGSNHDFTCERLLPGHQYRGRVCCSSLGGHSDWSECLSVSTQPVAPGVCPTPKLQGKAKSTYLHLRWDRPEYDGGAAIWEYEVLMTSPDNATCVVYKGRDRECAVAGLQPGHPYLYQVKACNKAGAGPWSEIVEVVSGPGVPDPPAPPVICCRSPHNVLVSWQQPVNNGAVITDYRVELQAGHDCSEWAQLYLGAALGYEVRALAPATLYHFRVQALNGAGAGPFSAPASCVMPSSSPAAVTSVRASTTPTSIHLHWHQPANNGSEITHYNIDIGDKQAICVEGTSVDCIIDELMPETLYKLRVQAMNAIGVGPFSTTVKVTTRSQPPAPPRLECATAGANSLKLKWGDGKNPDLIHYCLEVLRDNGSFHPVYQGSAQSHKVNKLLELTDYQLRICASNDAGEGSYSPISTFCTTKAPPPAVKLPVVCRVTLDGCTVEWTALKAMGRDTIVYVLQLQCRDQEYTQVYRGEATSFRLSSLPQHSECHVRVCAVRQSSDSPCQLTGAFSPGASFTTQRVSAATGAPSSASRLAERRPLTDQQTAVILLLIFTVIAIVIAFLAQLIIVYINGAPAAAAVSSPPPAPHDAL